MTEKKRRPPKLNKADKRDIDELIRANKALKGAVPNPIQWAPIIAFIAPIVARIAARYAAKYIANKFGKRLKLNYSQEAADRAAEQVSDMVLKRLK